MQTENLKVTGMTCGGCTSAVTRALVAIDGVQDIQVSLQKNVALASEVVVQYDEQFTSPDKLKLAVQAAGYGIEENATALNHLDGKSDCCS